MHCLVTKSHYTYNENFDEADRVVTELGDEPDIQIRLEDLKDLI
jgi:hypothetical protein